MRTGNVETRLSYLAMDATPAVRVRAIRLSEAIRAAEDRERELAARANAGDPDASYGVIGAHLELCELLAEGRELCSA